MRDIKEIQCDMTDVITELWKRVPSNPKITLEQALSEVPELKIRWDMLLEEWSKVKGK